MATKKNTKSEKATRESVIAFFTANFDSIVSAVGGTDDYYIGDNMDEDAPEDAREKGQEFARMCHEVSESLGTQEIELFGATVTRADALKLRENLKEYGLVSEKAPNALADAISLALGEPVEKKEPATKKKTSKKATKKTGGSYGVGGFGGGYGDD